jgi:hypothetical protein
MFWRKRKQNEASGEMTVTRGDDGVHTVIVRGELSEEVIRRLEVSGGKAIDEAGTVKVLWDLEQFQGWVKEPGAGNLDFLLKYDSQIEKIAVVGESQWEEDAMLFLGAGHRKAEVQYFQAGSMHEAREWLLA